jgi:hypothetical protein
MDPINIVALAFLAVAVWLVARPLVESVGTAGDVMAQLFVPPNRALGWPHGVQESDAPWGWRSPSAVIDPPMMGGPFDGADLEPLDPDALSTPIRAGSFVVPVQPVRRHRPH